MIPLSAAMVVLGVLAWDAWRRWLASLQTRATAMGVTAAHESRLARVEQRMERLEVERIGD